jgi:hypothetical protein
MGVGVHEILGDAGVPSERIAFLNLPKFAKMLTVSLTIMPTAKIGSSPSL